MCIKQTYMETLKDLFRGIKRFVINLIRYRKILWNDRDLDYAFTVDILLRKLELQERHFRKTRSTADWERMCSRISLARSLAEIAFNDGPYDNSVYTNINNYKRFYPWNYVPPEDRVYEGYLRENVRVEKAKMLFFKVLDQNLKEWWD